MSDKIFPKGIRVFNKHEKAPDFILGSLVITLNELVKFAKDNPDLLTEYNGEKQLKLQLQTSRDGKLLAVVDTYKKENKSVVEDSDPMPF